MPSAMLRPAPNAPRSRMPSTGVQRNACGRPVRVSVKPTAACAPPAVAVAVLVNVLGRGVHAGERLQAYDPQTPLPEDRPGPPQAVAARAPPLAPPVHGLRLAHRATQRAKLANRNYRRPSCLLAHRPAWTAVSAVGPSKRCTRMAARPSRLTATMWKIET